MKRRRLLSLGLALAMSAGILTESFSASAMEGSASSFYDSLVSRYAAPGIENRTEARWWMAEGAHTDETLEEEVQALYDAGFRGVELCQLDNGNINAGDYGYGSDQWNHDFHLVMNKALDLGMTLGLTSGTNWNTTNVPGLDPDSQAANQCVFKLNEELSAGKSRTGALPTNGDLRQKATFIGAYAYKKIGKSPITQDYRVIQTRENSSNPNTFTIETDFILDKQNTGFCFGAKDKNTFLMWQINTLDGGNDTVLLRPHVCKNGQWVNTQKFDITKAIGYKASELFGKKIHMKIEVKDGKTIDTYFNGSDTSAATYQIPTDKTGDFTLGKLMFRHNIKYANKTEELGRYDNIVVKDAAGAIVFEESFDDPSDTGFDGGEVADGMFKAGLEQVDDNVGSAIQLSSDGIIDLTDQVILNEDNRTGTLNWTAPNDGDYILMYYWQQGTAQQSKPSTKPSYCINYFDQEGVNATKEYWLEHVLNDPALNEKIKNGDVQLFMDSLEYNTGKGFANWSDDFAEEFKARKGYDITPYLILGIGLPEPKGIDWHPEVYGTYNLDDADLGQRILNDFHDVQTELYQENLLIPLRDWLHEYGIKLRAQISYGKYLEISEPSMAVDYPETERYNQANQLDLYRRWSGGAHLENKILSSETGAHGSYSYVYDYQTLMQEAYVQFAAGVSRMIWHVWTSQWAPTSVGVNWPGFQSISSLYSFGLREPGYSEYKEFNDHMGRVQQLLREGKSRTDIGMVHMKYGELILAPSVSGKQKHQNWLLRHEVMPGYFQSTELQDHGYTYDYFSPEFFNSEDVYFDADTHSLELAGYKALVLYENWLTLDGAQAILNYAKQGLKVVIQDGAAVQTPYNDGNDQELQAVLSQLKTLPTVRTAASADDVYEALQELGVDPSSEFAEENYQLLTQVRQDGDYKYLYAYNYCNDKYCGQDHTTGMGHGLNAQTEIRMEGTLIPYAIDAWSGEVTEISNYRYEDGKTVIPIDLDYGDVALYAFEPAEQEKLHVVSTDANATYAIENGVVVRATQSGDTVTKLSNGTEIHHTFDVPQPYELTDWNLTVENWTPGKEIFRTEEVLGLTTTEHTMDTLKTNTDVQLERLTTWDKIPEIGKRVSGKGYYSATFQWDSNADGAYLDFGKLVQSMQVTINGRKTTDVNMNNPVIDISDYLIAGENTIEMEYSSNLTNVQLARGAIKEADKTQNMEGYSVKYRNYGPDQAKIIPYVEKRIEFTSPTEIHKGILNQVIAYAEQAKASGEYGNAIEMVQISYDIALEHAQAVAANGMATQAEVDQAWKGLLNEIHKLGFVRGDKTFLAALLGMAKECSDKIDRYTEATAAIFTTEYRAALAVYDDGNTLQDEVTESENALLDALAQLRFRADKSVLEAVLAEASNVDATAYTPETVAGFNSAYDKASRVNSDPNAAQDEINAAAENLNAAMHNLRAIELVSRIQGGPAQVTGSSNAKTGESTPVSAVILIGLLSAGFVIGKKKR